MRHCNVRMHTIILPNELFNMFYDDDEISTSTRLFISIYTDCFIDFQMSLYYFSNLDIELQSRIQQTTHVFYTELKKEKETTKLILIKKENRNH